MLLQIWGNTAATFTQCFPQFRRCLIKEPQLTLLLLYEDHETLPRLIEVTPSMRVADLAIKQAQRPDPTTISNGTASAQGNAEK